MSSLRFPVILKSLQRTNHLGIRVYLQNTSRNTHMSDDCANVWIILFSHYHKICFCTHHTSSGGHTWDIFSMGTLFLYLENFPQHNASFPSPSSRSHTFPFTNVFSLRSETCELDLQNSSTPALDVTWKKAIWGSTFRPELNLCQQWWWEKMNGLGGDSSWREGFRGKCRHHQNE